jgi:hypothetical protein
MKRKWRMSMLSVRVVLKTAVAGTKIHDWAWGGVLGATRGIENVDNEELELIHLMK